MFHEETECEEKLTRGTLIHTGLSTDSTESLQNCWTGLSFGPPASIGQPSSTKVRQTWPRFAYFHDLARTIPPFAEASQIGANVSRIWPNLAELGPNSLGRSRSKSVGGR